MKYIAQIVAVIAFSTQCAGGTANSTDELLGHLAIDLKRARAAQSQTFPKINRRDVAALEGAPRSAIFNALGLPDNCRGALLNACQSGEAWYYLFWPYDPNDRSRGGGWALVFEIPEQRVKRAYWLAQK